MSNISKKQKGLLKDFRPCQIDQTNESSEKAAYNLRLWTTRSEGSLQNQEADTEKQTNHIWTLLYAPGFLRLLPIQLDDFLLLLM